MKRTYSPAISIRSNHARHHHWIWLAPAAFVPLALNGPNVILGLYALLVLSLGLKLLWRSGEPLILVFIFFYQWMQSGAGALYGNLIGIDLDHVPDPDGAVFLGAHHYASRLMLTGVLVLALAVRGAAGKASPEINGRIRAIVSSKPFTFWGRIYVLTWIFGTICAVIAPAAGGLRVPLLSLSGVKWAGFIILTFAAFSSPKPGPRRIWFFAFCFEFLLSVGGYFASFKDVFFFSLFGLSAIKARLTPRMVILSGALAAVMLVFAVVWTAVKSDYRQFSSGGSGQQQVTVSYGEGLNEIIRLASNLDRQNLSDSTDDLVLRLMYFQLFGVTANRVPSIIPYSGGVIWREAITRPFMPRILFPEKRAINDSDLTNQYTGLGLATAKQGTSISLGYMAEAYIDFGPIYMFFAIGALGLGIGLFYRWLLRRRGPVLVFGAALAPYALMPAHLAETSILKMVPSLVLTFIACLVILKLLAPMVLGRRRRPSTRWTAS